MNYVGIDWAYGRAAFCAMGEGGEITAEGLIPANEDGLAKLVLPLGWRSVERQQQLWQLIGPAAVGCAVGAWPEARSWFRITSVSPGWASASIVNSIPPPTG